MNVVMKIIVVLRDLYHDLGNIVKQFYKYTFMNWKLTLLFLAIFALVIAFLTHWEPKRQQRKQQRKAQRSYRKATRQETRLLNRDLHDLSQTCGEIMQMLDERIRVESNNDNLIYLREQYQALQYQLDNNQPLTETPENLLKLYLRYNTDTSSRLFGLMQELNRQYIYLINQ